MHFPHAVREPAMVIGAGRGVHNNNRNLIEPLIVSTLKIFSLCADTQGKFTILRKYGRSLKKPEWMKFRINEFHRRKSRLQKKEEL
jgi:hypothetical protein